MSSIEQLYREYEDTKDVCSFYNKYDDENRTSERFLLMRSLDKPDLLGLYNEHVGGEEPRGRFKEVLFEVYDTDITIEQILNYINEKRTELVQKRVEETEGLEELLRNFPIEECGIRNDKVDDIIKGFVRDKSIKQVDEMQSRLNNSILPRVKQYCLWSYYNQTANDLIELALLNNQNIIPTLRKIHDIDFFVIAGDKIIPFDLKITHISDDYFEKISKGLIRTDGSDGDDYHIGDHDSEIKTIRNGYKELRRTHDIPATTGLKKDELIDYMVSVNDGAANILVEQYRTTRKQYIDETALDLRMLEWWNYKYQGERLFSNNNRLYVFLAYKDQFVDGRPLKGRIEQLRNLITSLLNDFEFDDPRMHTIHYHYDKEASLTGDYTAQALSVLYVE